MDSFFCLFFNVLPSLSAKHHPLCVFYSLCSSVVAFQRQRWDDLHLIPMKYGDSLSEPPQSSHMSEPQTCSAIKPRDSESYGSLHTDDQSEDRELERLKDTDEFGQTEEKYAEKNVDGPDSEQHLIKTAVETNNQSKHTQTRFCVIL